MKIVIADDNEAMRKVLRAICESEGHTVVAEFGDGHNLVQYVGIEHPDIVCLDYEMPGKNGLALLAEMDVTVNHVDVIMITGSDDPTLQGHAADLGASGFIHKPFVQAQVINELNEIAKARGIVARTTAMPAAPTVSPQDTPVTTVPRSAVIIDDSGAIRLLLKGILEDVGIKVIGLAANAKEGIEILRKTHPAVLCLDVDMPGMSGIEALPDLRKASPQTKVVMITGNADRKVVEGAIAGGATGYFLKPIRPAKVETFMQKLLHC